MLFYSAGISRPIGVFMFNPICCDGTQTTKCRDQVAITSIWVSDDATDCSARRGGPSGSAGSANALTHGGLDVDGQNPIVRAAIYLTSIGTLWVQMPSFEVTSAEIAGNVGALLSLVVVIYVPPAIVAASTRTAALLMEFQTVKVL